MRYLASGLATVLFLLFTAPSGRADQTTSPTSGSSAASPRADSVSPAELLSELVDLKKQGFTNDLLVQYVSQKTLSSAMTGKDLSQWKQSGMPPEVIKAALARSAATLTMLGPGRLSLKRRPRAWRPRAGR
jgi:hypothetical protein